MSINSLKKKQKSNYLKKCTAGLLTVLCCSASMLGALPSNIPFNQQIIVSYAASINNSTLIGSSNSASFSFVKGKKYTHSSGGCYIVFQNDGNLVIYNKNNNKPELFTEL